MKNDIQNIKKSRLFGVVYTPVEIASSITKLALSKASKGFLNILEPSVGEGYFLDALQNTLIQNYQITAIDIDVDVFSGLKSRFEAKLNQFHFLNYDFIQYANTNHNEKFNLIIGNPPFIRKHNYSAKFKETLAILSSKTGFDLKVLKNSWAAFVVASDSLLSDDGVMTFIVPYELMNVSYGQTIQKEIFKHFERVDVYIPDEKAFKDIEQDAVAFIAQKKSVEMDGVFIHRVNNLIDLSIKSTQKVSYSTSLNISLDLKGFLLDEDTKVLLHTLRAKCKKVINYCESSPGIVTGANDFFILTKDDVEKYDLLPYARKILKKGSFLLKSPVFTSEDFHLLANKEPCYLIDLTEKDNNKLSISALKYIEKGVELGVHLGYKCRNRNNWYEVPVLESEKVFFFKRSHSFPRLCINDANVLVTDTAYQLKLKPNVSINSFCYSFYNSLTLLFAEIDGRFYGGGVLELTPSEFKALPLVYKIPSQDEFQNFIDLHVNSTDITESLQKFGDKWLCSELGLTKGELSIIQNALFIVRQHRLRHSS